MTHDSSSSCKVAEFEVHGVVLSTMIIANLDEHDVDVKFDDGVTQQTFATAIKFRRDNTPTVTSVTPKNGDVFGNYDITLTGTNLGQATITIDGKECTYQSSTNTQIVCTVAPRLTLPDGGNSFTVQVGNKNAILQASFEYVMRWSDPRTWGTDLPPVEGDFVFVPEGMTLYVDQSTPQLLGITTEKGNLIFADESDMLIKTGFITINQGKFIAGTEASPYTHNLTF